MSAFEVQGLGIACSVYLAAFVIYSGFLVYILFKKHLYARYRLLGIYALVRTGAQVAGLIFSIDGVSQQSALVAYIVMTSIGYFFIIQSTVLFLANQQVKYLGESSLLKPVIKNVSAKGIFRLIVIPATVLIVVGATRITNLTVDQLLHPDSGFKSSVQSAKVLLSIGSAIFLAGCVAVTALLCYSVMVHRQLRVGVMYLAIAAMPFLLLRATFGLASINENDMNYLYIPNYLDSGRLSNLVTYDYCLSTTPEFICAIFLLITYWVDPDITKDLSKNPAPEVEHTPIFDDESK